MIVLGIESSCDETAAAIYDGSVIRSNIIASQAVHRAYGGIVPELASRAHHKTITGTVQQALEEAETDLSDLDAIAVTQGPGLMGSLLVGLCFAKGLAISIDKPLVGVNHIDAHMYANFIDNKPDYPFVCLTVSGGHTRLVYVESPFNHQLLGKTRDDAAGEAFDKIGKLLGLPYPGGPEIDRRSTDGNSEFHHFPRALLGRGLDFSFSGLKTNVMYWLNDQNEQFVQDHINDLSASVSAAIVDVLISKLKRAVKKTGVKTVMLAGGVSANSLLRKRSTEFADKHGLTLLIPRLDYCTDNAAMIAYTGHMKAERGEVDSVALTPFSRMD